MPKYIGPFHILEIITPGASYKLDLSPELKAWGIHNVFHTSVLRIHVPNNNRHFPGQQIHQVLGLGESPSEWSINCILSHSGKGLDVQFKILWSTGDTSWAPYAEAGHLNEMDEYCEAMGISSPKKLPAGKTKSDIPTELSFGITSCSVEPCVHIGMQNMRHEFKNKLKATKKHNKFASTLPTMPQSYPPSLPLMEHSNTIEFSHQEQACWIEYSNALCASVEGQCPHPGIPPCGYNTYMHTNPSATNPSQYPRPPIVPAVNMMVEQTQSMADINMLAQGLKTILEAQVVMY
ncbi:hypothetical protein BDQ17DRAFT_1243440 [Cyathus striatus]|nr:hypothetical protein BDQ17DRAFT_1243440 [Cyathus striatus]